MRFPLLKLEAMTRRKLLALLLAVYAAAAAGAIVQSRQYVSPQCEVALLGDSIFAQLRDGGALARPLNEACNLGRSGARMSEIASTAVPASAKIIFLEGGLNDLLAGADVEPIAAAYRSALEAAPRARVLLVGILPVDHARMRPRYAAFATQEKIDRVNAALTGMCGDFANCELASTVRDFSPSDYTTDGIHPTAPGLDELVWRLARDLYASRGD